MRLPVVFVACLMLALPAGCGGDDSDGGSGGGDKEPAAKKAEPSGGGAQAPAVAMKDIAFDPKELSVKQGTKVTWTNDDAVGHDVTSSGGPGAKYSSGDPGGLSKGDTFSHTFTKPGTYEYVCTVHSGMSGSVTVK